MKQDIQHCFLQQFSTINMNTYESTYKLGINYDDSRRSGCVCIFLFVPTKATKCRNDILQLLFLWALFPINVVNHK